jgi:8-oxo-dGTP pyrophosphatase MutT (NUDIX family)
MWEQDVTLPTGTMIMDYLVMERRNAVLVFAVTEDDKVIMTEQYRHGIGAVEIGLPAGFLDDIDGGPLACARRELLEETGYTSDDWMPLGDFAVDPNRSQARYHYFLAQRCYPVAEQRLEEAEVDLALRFVPLADLCDWHGWREQHRPNLPTVTGLVLGLREVNNNDNGG